MVSSITGREGLLQKQYDIIMIALRELDAKVAIYNDIVQSGVLYVVTVCSISNFHDDMKHSGFWSHAIYMHVNILTLRDRTDLVNFDIILGPLFLLRV